MILLRISRKARLAAPGAAVLALLALAAPAMAVPRDKAACAKLALDMQNMKMLEVEKLMAKGPAWAASNLSDTDLTLVRQYIDLDEQLKFRCSVSSPILHFRHIEVEEEQSASTEGAEKGQTGDGEETPAAAAPAAKQKSAKAPAKKAAPKAGGAQ